MSERETQDRKPIVAVVGAGAVGCFFGGMLARAGAQVTLLGRPESENPHLEAVSREGLRIDGVAVRETVPVSVSRRPTDVGEADLVLLAVKTTDTKSAVQSIANHLSPKAIVVSLQNGIDNVEIMAQAGVRALPSVVFVAAEIESPGAVRHRGRGDLILGPEEDPASAAAVSGWFEAAGVPCPVSEEFAEAQWTKLIINAMANAISALGGASYRTLFDFEPAWKLAISAAREAAEVALGLGIDIDIDEVMEIARGIVLKVGDATSSMEQDLARGRRTEIQSLNGIISLRGAELGIPTPTHDALSALVGLREQSTGS